MIATNAFSLYGKYKTSTMVDKESFVTNLELMQACLKNENLRLGAIVECGTWRGGMSAAMIETGGPDRDYYFFDSFEGLPLAQTIDGPAALAYQSNTDSLVYYNNCKASIHEFLTTLDKISVVDYNKDRVRVIKGFFEETFATSAVADNIAVLRLDCDWYASIMTCLNALWWRMLPGGLILIDDYYTWDGCSRAVHDFLAARKAPEKIRQSNGVAYIIKLDEAV